MPADPLLEVRALRLSAPDAGGRKPLVDGLSFQLGRGERLALVGGSGSGKSLTALTILGLLPPGIERDGGSVHYDGVELTALPEAELRRYRGGRIATVFQEPREAFNPVLRVGRQVEEVLELHRALDRAARRAEVVRLFEEVGLPEAERLPRCYPHELSGGMLQRVMIATAIAGEPELLLADEPTTALDVTVQAQILDLVARLCAERDLTLLWISHDLAVVAQVCERVAVLHDGRVVEEGPVEALYREPSHPFTRELLAAAPRLERRS